MIDLASCVGEMSREENERKRLEALTARYRAELPNIQPQWDLRLEAVQYNDINEAILASGMSVYRCSMNDLWSGIYDPSVYEANTIWRPLHAEHKIIRVIEAWEMGVSLSPLFLVKHGTLNLGLVADGKHRLTVCRAIRALEVPFMVGSADEEWVERAIPGSVKIDQ
jgi:hypothetical protein